MKRRNGMAPMLLVGVLVLGACGSPAGQEAGEASAADTAAILSSIDSLRSAYEEAVASADWQRLGRMVSEEAVMVSPGLPEWDSLRAAGPGPFPSGATLDITPRETRVLGADWVYELGSSVITWTPEGTDTARTLRDSYLVILHRTDDGWKVHREVASSGELPETAGSD